MIIRSLTLDEDSPFIVVRWTLNGEYDQAHDSTGRGVDVPDDARIIDVNFYGSSAMTMQVIFDPAWSEEFA
jgi:hypothetical protein